MLLKPCPNFVPVLQPSQLCVKQEPQRTVSFAVGRDQDFWRHISWKQQLGTRIAGSSYDLRDSISAVGFTPCCRALLQDLPVLGFPINIGYSYFVRSMFRKWDLSKKKKKTGPSFPLPIHTQMVISGSDIATINHKCLIESACLLPEKFSHIQITSPDKKKPACQNKYSFQLLSHLLHEQVFLPQEGRF